MQSIVRYIEKGQEEGRLIAGGKRVGTDGYFLEPTVIADVAPDATIAQEEIFGPVLAVIKAKDFDDAMAIANNTEFGLTGSLYTSDEEKIERARDEFFVGNLYFNRKSTGAMVGVHPVRRLQHVRHRQQGRRPRLPAAVHAGQNDLAKSCE